MLKRFLAERQDPALKCARVGHALRTVRRSGVMTVEKWQSQPFVVVKHFSKQINGVMFVERYEACQRCEQHIKEKDEWIQTSLNLVEKGLYCYVDTNPRREAIPLRGVESLLTELQRLLLEAKHI